MVTFKRSQLKQIIEEEAQKVTKELRLKKELRKVEAELKALNEVHPGGEMSPGPEGYHAGQHKAVFTKKGSHLIENPEEEEIMAGSGDDMDAVGATAGAEDFGGEGGGVETLDKETVMNAIKALGHELGLSGVIDFSEAPEGMMGGEGEGDEEISIDEPAGDEVGVDIESPEEAGPEEHIGHEPKHEEGVEECGTQMQQEEPEMVAEEEGPVPAQTKPGKEKNALAPEAPGTPNVKTPNPTFGEGVKPKKSAKLLAEEIRWKTLAGIK